MLNSPVYEDVLHKKENQDGSLHFLHQQLNLLLFRLDFHNKLRVWVHPAQQKKIA